jgi:tetratricopeptide (TPR) repeat protein
MLRQGHRTEALAHWQKALQLNPRLYDALYNLGTVLYSIDRREARPYLERFVREAPPSRYASDIAQFRTMLSK